MLQVKHLRRPRVGFDIPNFQRARRDAENGDWRRLIRMMEEAEHDPFISGCLIGRRSGVRRDFSVDPFDAENASDLERAAWMKAVVQNLNPRRLFRQVQRAQLIRYSVTDFEWEVVDAHQVPVRMEVFDPHQFRFDPKTKQLRVDWGELREIPDDVLVCESDEPPVMLTILAAWILTEFGWESYSAFLEIVGEPFLWATIPEAASDEYKKAVETGLNELGSSGRGYGPPGSEPKMIEGSDTEVHDRFLSKGEERISVGILGHANAVRQSAGLQVGDNSNAYKVREDIMMDDLDRIDACLEPLIQRIYDQNYSDGRYPRFRVHKPLLTNVDTHIKRLKCLYDLGATILPSELAKLGVELDPDQEPITRQRPNLFD